MAVRRFLVLLHRWAGLGTALFLFVAGLTGAAIAWRHELDEWLNPHLFQGTAAGDPLPALCFVERVERADPRARVAVLPLQVEAGKAVALLVQPAIDPATGKPHRLGYNQIFFDPVSGRELGRREAGRVSLDREHLMAFLYRLHFSLYVPPLWGLGRLGIWLMGAAAIVWLFDCAVGFWLTLPLPQSQPRGGAGEAMPLRSWWRRWRPAWRVKLPAGAYRITFDLHRAFGLWLWAALFVLALTSISLNLRQEVARPVISLFSSLTPTPFEQLAAARSAKPPGGERISFAAILERAVGEAGRRGWSEPAGSISHSPTFGVYWVRFFHPGGEHTSGTGPATLYFNDTDARLLGQRVPWEGTAGDLFMQAQLPLHSGRIAGLPGRLLVSATGIAVAVLSVTGVMIWDRKRRARSRREEARRHSRARPKRSQ